MKHDYFISALKCQPLRSLCRSIGQVELNRIASTDGINRTQVGARNFFEIAFGNGSISGGESQSTA
jgi:hypothetical protein